MEDLGLAFPLHTTTRVESWDHFTDCTRFTKTPIPAKSGQLNCFEIFQICDTEFHAEDSRETTERVWVFMLNRVKQTLSFEPYHDDGRAQ